MSSPNRTHRMRRAAAAAATAVLTASLLSACAPSPSTPAPEPAPEPTPAPSMGRVIFDMGHGEVFAADDTSELGQSAAVQRMRDAGFDVFINRDTITGEDLADASGLVIAGPMRPLLAEEYDAITAFAKRGGTVLLTIHVPFPVLKVPAHWGLPVGTEIMLSKRPLANAAEPSVFAADVVKESRITEGVDRIAVVSGWPVEAFGDGAELLVSTGPDTWLAATGDQAQTPDETVQMSSYGVIGATRVGSGIVIVSGDDAIFSNFALPAEDNAQLLDNIIRLMSESTDV